MKKRIDINSPVILGLSLISLILLVLDLLFKFGLNAFLAVRYTSFLDYKMYIRLFTHVLAHADLAHFAGNFLLILAVGPLVEEKYSSKKLLSTILITALITGLINVIFFKNTMLLGASGIAFMLILMASFTNTRRGRLPLTFILIALLYIGREVYNGLFTSDNISQISHIVGGICGSVCGLLHSQKH